MITLTEAKEEMKKPAPKRRRVIYKGEPAHLSTVGVAAIGLVLESELEKNRISRAYTVKFKMARPEELEWEND